jgi:hypothetical protein
MRYIRMPESGLVAIEFKSPDGKYSDVREIRSLAALQSTAREFKLRPQSRRRLISSSATTSTHHSTKKSPAQLDREIAAALGDRNDTDRDDGVFYLTDTHERPLGPEFPTRGRAKRAAMRLVREGVHPLVEVWHRWRGDRYMQGAAKKDGWSDV